ncbi:hypothetical protein [Aeromonas dhakensis]|uniref:hypothetical protein n=1 Tax=Aeromonas TaxID=642 RepID=UPI00197FB176|nr:hypothetical protein [Aeromonas dhakensis]MBW3730423.1 hypothetical protein [Aeromonas dhakensis]QSR55125.1 hypothetical protein GO601_06595 [Aeromonas dhakensis]HCT2508593.1 hypothetical protein [Aeromonas dhakensis]
MTGQITYLLFNINNHLNFNKKTKKWIITMKSNTKKIFAFSTALLLNHSAFAGDFYLHDSFSSDSLSNWNVYNQTSEKSDIKEENSSLKIVTRNPLKDFKFSGISKTFEPKKNISLSTVVQGDFSNLSNINPRAYVLISNSDETEGTSLVIGRDGNNFWGSQVCMLSNGCLPAKGHYSNMSKLRLSIMKVDDMIRMYVNGDLVYSGTTSLQEVSKVVLAAGGANTPYTFPVYFNEFSLHSGN